MSGHPWSYNPAHMLHEMNAYRQLFDEGCELQELVGGGFRLLWKEKGWAGRCWKEISFTSHQKMVEWMNTRVKKQAD